MYVCNGRGIIKAAGAGGGLGRGAGGGGIGRPPILAAISAPYFLSYTVNTLFYFAHFPHTSASLVREVIPWAVVKVREDARDLSSKNALTGGGSSV